MSLIMRKWETHGYSSITLSSILSRLQMRDGDQINTEAQLHTRSPMKTQDLFGNAFLDSFVASMLVCSTQI